MDCALCTATAGIIGIMPIVMDMLDFEHNVGHMMQAYGNWTFAFQPVGSFCLRLGVADSPAILSDSWCFVRAFCCDDSTGRRTSLRYVRTFKLRLLQMRGCCSPKTLTSHSHCGYLQLIGTQKMHALGQIVDPLVYKSYLTMPKLVRAQQIYLGFRFGLRCLVPTPPLLLAL